MKKALLLLTTSLLLTACSQAQNSALETSPATTQAAASDKAMTYHDYTSVLTEVSFDELTKKIDQGDEFILYIGKESCKGCNLLVPKLHTAVTEQQATVFYFSAEHAETEELLFLSETFNITSTPNLSYYQGDKQLASVENAPQASVEQIRDFLALNS